MEEHKKTLLNNKHTLVELRKQLEENSDRLTIVVYDKDKKKSIRLNIITFYEEGIKGTSVNMEY